MEKVTRKTELLAPAGSPACALAAFDAGADAIYCGLAKFNARERGENFSPEVLAKVIQYAHSIGRKVYITFNTLIKESELPSVVEHLALLEKMDVDALIVQDLGVLRLIREYFPNIEIHASTQMGIHNSVGVDLGQQLGAERVILERQITLDELKTIRKSTDLELEVFIHGALCCSLSGQCLFSSYLGGYSGNRGRCKQPCRRRFFTGKGNGFFFSPQDLCTIELVPELRDMGIDSLKIEGRLRQPDYVYNVVSAYRMVLDTPTEKLNSTILGEARRLLSKSCGRKWSQGFFFEESMKNLIAHDNIGSAGMLCGDVAEIAENGFYFVAKKKIHVGDRLRVQPHSGDDGPAMTVTKMFVDNKDVKKATVGQMVFVCYDREVPLRGAIYKIGESFKDYNSRLENLKDVRKKIDLKVAISRNLIHVETCNTLTPFVWEKAIELADAAKHPLDKARTQEEFASIDSQEFSLGKISVEIDGSYFMPGAVFKNLRREFYNQLKSAIKVEDIVDSTAEALAKFYFDYKRIIPSFAEVAPNSETVAMKVNGETPGNRKAKKAISIFDFNKETNQVILPEFTPEGRIETLKKAIKIAYDSGIRSFRVSSLFELALLQGYADIEVVASCPLPICNSLTVMELKKLGVDRVLGHVELDRKALEDLRDKSVLPLEVYRFGRPVILNSRATINVDGTVKDARNNSFMVKKDNRSRLTKIYPQEIVSIPRIDKTFDYYDLQNANWNAKETSKFNFDLDLL